MRTDIFSPASPAYSRLRSALLLGLMVFIASLFCQELMAIDNKLSPIWYASAIMTVVVFRYRGVALAQRLLACLAGTLLANLTISGLSIPSVTFPLLNLLQAILGGGLLRLLLKPESALDTLANWWKMVMAVGVIAPLGGSLLALWWVHFLGGDPGLRFLTTWALAEIIGMLTIGPICLLWRPDYFRAQRHTLPETLGVLAASLLLCFIAMRFLPWPFTFVIAILFWAAVRLPRFEAFCVFFANVSLISLMLVLHLFQLRAANPSFVITAPWLPFLLVLIPSHIMTMVMHAFREEKKHISESEEVNRRLMERITLANEAGGIGVWEWDVLNDKMSWDKRMRAIYEVDADEQPTYAFWLSRLAPEDSERAQEAVRRALEENVPFSLECRVMTRHGLRYIRSHADSILNADGQVARLLGINQDITELRVLTEALYQEKERMLITLDAIGEAVISTDEEMRVTFMNPVAEQMSGWTQAQAAGKPLGDILRITHGEHGPALDDLLRGHFPANGAITDLDRDLMLHNANGERFAIHYSMRPLKTLTGRHIGSVLVIQDVSESRELLKRLHYSASHDTLTRLPNRASFEHQLKRLLHSACEQQQHHVLAFIDLDRFKAVNDSAGHAAGDALLYELADVMRRLLSSDAFLARLGGDEFGLLLSDCAIAAAREQVQRIVTAVNDYRFLWEGKLHRIGASAGLTAISALNCQSGEVLAQADLACYNAKHNGRGQLSVYETRLQQPQPLALSQEEIIQLIGAPLRWQAWPVSPPHKPQAAAFHLLQARLPDAQGHEIDMEDFRAALSNDALSLRLDHALIDSFFTLYAPNIARKALNVVLPLSVHSLLDAAWPDAFFNALDRSALRGELLIVSLDCQALLQHAATLRPMLMRLRERGCRILLRNFGRNLDAFGEIPHEQIDFIQLAPDLIANVHFNLMDEMLVSIIHGQAQRLHIATVAGPVDLPATLSTLAGIGIDAVWGEAVHAREPLNALLENSFFAIK